MAASYPSSLVGTGSLPDTAVATTSTVGGATDHATVHNQVADEIIAIETELGTLPKGQYATAKSRLNNGEHSIYSTLAVQAVADGILAQTADADIVMAGASGGLATNQRLTCGAIWLPAGAVIKGHRHFITVVGGAVTVASAVCLLTSDGNAAGPTLTVVAGKFSAIGVTTVGFRANAYSAPYTVLADGIFYLGHWVSSANAQPTLAQINAASLLAGDNSLLLADQGAGWPRMLTVTTAVTPSLTQTYTGFVTTNTNFPWQAAFGTRA